MQDMRTGEWRTLLMDIKDYEDVLSNLIKSAPGQSFKAAIFDVRPQKGSLILRSTAPLHESPWNENEWSIVMEKLVKIKVFNRQMNFYNRHEIEALKRWTKKEPSNIQTYFNRSLLLPSMQETYPGSTLGMALA